MSSDRADCHGRHAGKNRFCLRCLSVLKGLPVPVLGLLLCLQLVEILGSGLRNAYAEAGEHDRTRHAKPELQVTPASCVALHRGQVCFQRLQLRWSNPAGHHLCLFLQSDGEALHCTSLLSASYRHDYGSDDSEVFVLRRGVSGEVLATATVSTVWVYRTGKRSSSGWRLF